MDLNEFRLQLSNDEEEKFKKLKSKYLNLFDQISEFLYEKLTSNEQKWFIIWFVKRWGGISKIPYENYTQYISELNRIKSIDSQKFILKDVEYKFLQLTPQGFKGELLTYKWVLGIHDFLFKQYSSDKFKINPGDVIIDAGAFVGDTAVIFNQESSGDCVIHSFELLDENILLLNFNLKKFNISESVTINKLALSDTSGSTVFINKKQVQGATSILGAEEGEGIETITIDDYVNFKGIQNLDLIKMDIEGAERLALKGSLDSIRKFKPKLAICIYHLWDDVIEIPKIIKSTGVDYMFEFKWVEFLHGWEAVLLCSPPNEFSRNN